MNYLREEGMAFLASDLFQKRQRLLQMNNTAVPAFPGRASEEAEQEYRQAEADYLEAKAAFARAMKLHQTAK